MESGSRSFGLGELRLINSFMRPQRRSNRCHSTLLLVALALPATAFGQAEEALRNDQKTMRLVRLPAAPVIDGRLDEDVWSQATLVEDLHQIDPVEYVEPSERTSVRVFYTEDALYVGARLWDDEPDAVTARILRQGERISGEDMFYVMLDPFHDRRNGYRFAVNPNGVRDDYIYQNTNEQLRDWEGIWSAAATQDEYGWIAEIEIPFKTLSFDPRNDEWGINFIRHIARKGEWTGWVSRNRNANPSIAGVATGLSELEQGVGLDIVPSVSVRGQKSYFPSNTQTDTEPSLDVFYKLTPSINASLTINTDFSATEVDDRQVDLSRFSLFFPEKRAFFLRDSDIFQFGRLGPGGGFSSGPTFSRPSLENGRPFFSRRIGLGATGTPVDIEYGGKLSGRVGRWSMGALAIRQDAFEDVDATDIFVGRAAANVLAESSVGVIMTSGDPRSNLDNSLMGVDFRYLSTRVPGGRELLGDAWYQKSDTDGLDGDDEAWGLRLQTPNRVGFRGGIGIKEIQNNFNPAVGFVNRSGVRDQTLELGYTHWPRDSYFRSVFWGVDVQRIELLTGGLQTQIITFRPLELENDTSDSIDLRYTANKEVIVDPFEISEGIFILPGAYAYDEYGFDVGTGGQRKLSGSFTYRTGDFFDGQKETLGGSFSWAPSRRFRTALSYDVNDVELPQGDFTVRLVTFRTDIVFSSTLSWVNLIQYDNVSETAGINSRLHWIPEAGREAFIVLNHNLQDVDRDGSFRSIDADLTLKFNYTFRF